MLSYVYIKIHRINNILDVSLASFLLMFYEIYYKCPYIRDDSTKEQNRNVFTVTLKNLSK